MLLSFEKQFLFVHVPRAAGTSVRDTLAPYIAGSQQYLINRLLDGVGLRVNHVGPFPKQRFRVHDTARIAKFWLPCEAYDRLFKFAFVRNPWDRMVSMYSYIRMRTDHRRHREVTQLKGFEDYLKYEFRRRVTSQLEMISDRRGKIIVDYVGRFERLETDFADVCQHIGIESQFLHKNQSQHEPYENYYNDCTRRLVADYFANEIEYFGYEFDAIESVITGWHDLELVNSESSCSSKVSVHQSSPRFGLAEV